MRFSARDNRLLSKGWGREGHVRVELCVTTMEKRVIQQLIAKLVPMTFSKESLENQQM